MLEKAMETRQKKKTDTRRKKSSGAICGARRRHSKNVERVKVKHLNGTGKPKGVGGCRHSVG